MNYFGKLYKIKIISINKINIKQTINQSFNFYKTFL